MSESFLCTPKFFGNKYRNELLSLTLHPIIHLFIELSSKCAVLGNDCCDKVTYDDGKSKFAAMTWDKIFDCTRDFRRNFHFGKLNRDSICSTTINLRTYRETIFVITFVILLSFFDP